MRYDPSFELRINYVRYRKKDIELAESAANEFCVKDLVQREPQQKAERKISTAKSFGGETLCMSCDGRPMPTAISTWGM